LAQNFLAAVLLGYLEGRVGVTFQKRDVEGAGGGIVRVEAVLAACVQTTRRGIGIDTARPHDWLCATLGNRAEAASPHRRFSISPGSVSGRLRFKAEALCVRGPSAGCPVHVLKGQAASDGLRLGCCWRSLRLSGRLSCGFLLVPRRAGEQKHQQSVGNYSKSIALHNVPRKIKVSAAKRV